MQKDQYVLNKSSIDELQHVERFLRIAKPSGIIALEGNRKMINAFINLSKEKLSAI